MRRKETNPFTVKPEPQPEQPTRRNQLKRKTMKKKSEEIQFENY
jgi:hypothetical protein